jgi:hypothetical protein
LQIAEYREYCLILAIVPTTQIGLDVSRWNSIKVRS